jgi:2,4-dienoyl-CoA reductase-like NADH-dependent reductase (Old Yellow Enzyme family)/thioredoxin reductase
MPKLKDPIQIGKRTIKNRLWAGVVNVNWYDWFGFPMQQAVEFYEERARGGFGMVGIAGGEITTWDFGAQSVPRIYHPKHVIALSRLTDAIHRWGACAEIQLMHMGRQNRNWIPDPIYTAEQLRPMAPSSSTPKLPGVFGELREMTLADIQEVQQAFARSAALAKRAQFDGVVLHFSHGQLVQQFMSPWTNHRTDKYGVQNGGRFGVEIIQRVRETVGADFIIGVRLAAGDALDDVTKMKNPMADPQKPHLTLDMVKNYAKQFEAAGADYFNVSAGVFEATHVITNTLYGPYGYFVKWAEEIKRVVNIPVVSGGKINDPALAESLVEQGKLDAVFMARQMLADSDTPRKFFLGLKEDIRKCISCGYCLQRVFGLLDATCAVNPDVSTNKLPPVKPSKKPRKILVVGGGVAGMEAARLASIMGHNVSLYEKANELGGLVKAVSEVPRLYMKDLNNIVIWLKAQLKKLNVNIELGQQVTPDIVHKVKPDVVILATGSRFDGSNIPGADKPIVLSLDRYLKGENEVGQSVAILGIKGAEVAVSLAREGKKVTLLTEGPAEAIHSVPWLVSFTNRSYLLLDYIKKEPNLTFLPSIKIQKVVDEGVIFSNGQGKKQSLKVDRVVTAVNQNPVSDLEKILEAEGYKLFKIGDCAKPGIIRDAVYDANFLIREKLEVDL